MLETHISLAHGNGGRFMRELIDELFARYLHNPELDTHVDAVTLPWEHGALVITTDGFTVQPLTFPGGDIGSLAVHGTTNDLAVAGAIPRYLTLNAFIEEGFEIALLTQFIQSMAAAAQAVNVAIVAGDTKILRRGEGSGVYFATTGVGWRATTTPLSLRRVQPGDMILVSGPVGDHGIAVMLAREQFGLRGELLSDAASVLPLTRALLPLAEALRVMRDPTRGGLATVLHECTQACGYTIRVQETAIPIRPEVQTVCEMLGYDALYLACEGRVVAVVSAAHAAAALAAWQALPTGAEAAIIGTVTAERGERVVLTTELGGERLLEELEDDPLPRIC